MADEQYDQLQMVGLHEPDYSVETDTNGKKTQVELPGFYHVGFLKDGVFRPVYSMKAAGLFADIERAKNSASSED